MLRNMAKKKPENRADATFNFRCKAEDLELFRFASEREGFGGTIATWLLYHARKQARQHEDEFRRKDR